MRRISGRSGFGLIEMAVIMVIVGVIIATIMPRILGRIGTDKAQQAKFDIQAVRDEIIGYAAVNGNLPQPATGAGGYGVVPKAHISHHLDAWGQEIGYVTAQDADGDQLYDINVNDADAPAQLTVDLFDYDGGSQLSTKSNVAFIVYSIGADKTKDVDESGVASGVGTFIHYPFGVDLDNNSATAGENDDIVEYVILDYLQDKAEASAGSTPTASSSDVTQADDSADFDGGTGSNPPGIGTTVTINPDGSFTLLKSGGATDGGCLWYQGDNSTGNCSSGRCDFNYGFRAYFRFKFADQDDHVNSQNHGGGFVFTVFDGQDNGQTACGDYQSGAALGYSGGTPGIVPEKVAVEVDTRRHNSGPTSRNDPSGNHVAWVWWSDTSPPLTAQTTDNSHTVYAAAPGDPNYRGSKNPLFSGTGPDARATHAEVKVGGQPNWLEDTDTHTMRIEIYRNATTGSSNGDVVNATAWIDCAADCSDLTQPYAGTADALIQQNNTMGTNATINDFQKYRFGWAFASDSGLSQEITITDFAIKFLNGEPNHDY